MISRRAIGRQSKATGKLFEELITKSCTWYEDNGIAKIEKQSEPMRVIRPLSAGKFLCCFESRAGADYKGTLFGGKAVVFEAKHTDTHVIKRDRVKEWQLDYMVDHKNLGAEVFVLLSYGMQGFYRVPILDWVFMQSRFGKVARREEDIAQYKLEFNGYQIKFLEGLL